MKYPTLTRIVPNPTIQAYINARRSLKNRAKTDEIARDYLKLLEAYAELSGIVLALPQ